MSLFLLRRQEVCLKYTPLYHVQLLWVYLTLERSRKILGFCRIRVEFCVCQRRIWVTGPLAKSLKSENKQLHLIKHCIDFFSFPLRNEETIISAAYKKKIFKCLIKHVELERLKTLHTLVDLLLNLPSGTLNEESIFIYRVFNQGRNLPQHIMGYLPLRISALKLNGFIIALLYLS